jgi:hypothetical protein
MRTDSIFASRCVPGQWICYGFGARRVTPTHYSIRNPRTLTADLDLPILHLRSWVLEVSDDGSQWREADRRIDVEELNGFDALVTFEVASQIECSFIRLRQLGPAWSGRNGFALSAFEIFGQLTLPHVQ